MKEAKIFYNGKEETLQLDDNPTAAAILPIVKRTMKYKVGQAQPEIDTDEWMIGIATNLITKAPWVDTKNPSLIRSLPWKTYAELAKILGDEYPLIDFLSPGLSLLYGKRLESVELPSQTESTTSSASGASPQPK